MCGQSGTIITKLPSEPVIVSENGNHYSFEHESADWATCKIHGIWLILHKLIDVGTQWISRGSVSSLFIPRSYFPSFFLFTRSSIILIFLSQYRHFCAVVYLYFLHVWFFLSFSLVFLLFVLVFVFLFSSLCPSPLDDFLHYSSLKKNLSHRTFWLWMSLPYPHPQPPRHSPQDWFLVQSPCRIFHHDESGCG